MRWRRFIGWLLGGLAVLIILASIAGYFVLRSDWFYNKVRLKLIATIETATGGRVEIGSFRFDWAHLRAEVRNLVVHGTEPAGKPPLLRAPQVSVQIKVISLSRRDIDIQALEVTGPHIYLIIRPDGSTNVPEPKVKSKKTATESLLDAAIGRLVVERGLAEVEGHGAKPFSIRGENLSINLAYQLAGPRYQGTFSSAPMRIAYDDYGPEPFRVNLDFTIEKNRVAVNSGKAITAATSVEFTGALEDLTAPHARIQYTARTSLTDIRRIFRVPELRQGTAMVSGAGTWTPAAGVLLTGTLHASGVEYRDSTIRLTGVRAEGSVEAGPKGVAARNLAIAGDFVHGANRERVEGRVREVTVQRKDVDVRGAALALLGGSFHGDVSVRTLDHYKVDGQVSGVNARRAVALYSDQEVPWNALASGGLHLEGSLRRPQDLRAVAHFTISPAPDSDPVSGRINAVYEARGGGNLELDDSSLSLPHSRADFSGSLGRELTVHLQTTDLGDLSPLLSRSPTPIPLKLNNGSIAFDGTVTGNLTVPRLAGHVRASGVMYEAERIDSFEADVQASPDMVRLQNATASRGQLRAQFQGSLGLTEWKPTDASPISATATLNNASAADLLAAARAKDVPLTGTISGSGQVSGTLGNMQGQGDITAVQGVFRGQPYDRFTAHAAYANSTLDVSGAQLIAGTKQLQFNVNYKHVPNHFDQGRVHFQVSSNDMPMEQIQAIAEARPDLKGTVEVKASGDVEITPSTQTHYRIGQIQADISAKNVQFGGQPVGDAHITANTQGSDLRAHLESTLAGSSVRGDGEWRLEGDYPGKATVQFSKVDLARLKEWLSPGEAPPFTGSAEGQLQIAGPLERWQAMTAELRIRQFQLGAVPGNAINGQTPSVHNAGDMVFRFANSTITAESAHLVGPGTDLSVTGRILPDQKAPLDLRVDGKLDLGYVHNFFPDFTASGGVATSATIRGAFNDPQVFGRLEFQSATFNVADVPNGISKATGVIIFNKDRATIQDLNGETGGGKIRLTGFVSYGASHTPVFRLHARASEVRVRYPEGVSTVADANLNLTGTIDNSVLSGTITVLRTGINLQSDFSSILAKSAEPVSTPLARTGFLGGMSFDVQIETAPDVQLQSTLTENVQAEANLKLRGTASSPALLGRINITQGKLSFFGTEFTLSQGSISFFNPVKIEPILNIDLETRARGVDITLTVSGPLNKLTLTPRSDPPLQFSEIVALLATGRTPTSDPSLWTQQANSQSWTQLGASALLGSAIASPVAGRLQRFFGVSKLRIDPTINGVENNPQARLTLEQQITPDITFTYITNVTTSNPQIVRVEWAFSRQWSVVALREENGLFGLDFFYKRRFK